MTTTFKNLQERFGYFCVTHKIDQELYFVKQSDARQGKRAAIMKNEDGGCVSLVTDYYTYPELNAWMDGYNGGLRQVFK